MKKMLILLFFILSIVGCSSETKPFKENVIELSDRYDNFKINTTNKIQTTCHSQYVFLNMYLKRIKEIMQLK